MLHLIDRRLNGRGKSAVNRERFLRRYKAQIQRAVKGMVARALASPTWSRAARCKVPAKDISEPAFGFGHGGDREIGASGQPRVRARRQASRGPKAAAAAAAAAARPATATARTTSCSRCRARSSCSIFFDDLELPNLARTDDRPTPSDKKSVRAGYVKDGRAREPCGRAHA